VPGEAEDSALPAEAPVVAEDSALPAEAPVVAEDSALPAVEAEAPVVAEDSALPAAEAEAPVVAEDSALPAAEAAVSDEEAAAVQGAPVEVALGAEDGEVPALRAAAEVAADWGLDNDCPHIAHKLDPNDSQARIDGKLDHQSVRNVRRQSPMLDRVRSSERDPHSDSKQDPKHHPGSNRDWCEHKRQGSCPSRSRWGTSGERACNVRSKNPSKNQWDNCGDVDGAHKCADPNHKIRQCRTHKVQRHNVRSKNPSDG